MQVQRLEYFVALATYLNYSQTAKELYISQPALTKQINLLEQELGVKLFNRNKHMVSLTAEGRECLHYANSVIAASQRMTDWAATVKQPKLPSLRLGYYGIMMQGVAIALTQELWALRPDIEVSLRFQNINTLAAGINNNSLDLVILREAYCSGIKNVIQQKLCTAKYRLLVPSAHPLAKETRVRLRDLKNEQFVTFSKQSFPQTYYSLLRLCRKYDLTPQIAYECVDPLTFFLMVQSGRYLALCHAVTDSVGNYDLRLVDLDCSPDDLESNIMAVWSKTSPNSITPCLEELVQRVQASSVLT